MGKGDEIMCGILGPPAQTEEFCIDLFYTSAYNLFNKKPWIEKNCSKTADNQIKSINFTEVLAKCSYHKIRKV